VNKRFLLFLLAGLAVAGGVVFIFLTATSGAHLRLEGKILKVRVLSLPGSRPDKPACLVVVDFRATNPSDVLFVGSSVKLQLDPATGESVEGTPIAKPDVENIFRYEKLLGPQYNPVYSLQDRIPPHRSVDRMAAARMDVAEAVVQNRKALRLRIEDVDGAVAELTEAK
jgi:hypothetical protein